jgi:hypothetical protein
MFDEGEVSEHEGTGDARRDPVEPWRRALNADPLPWLLEEETSAVRHLALRWLAGEAADSPAVHSAREGAMQTDPIAAFLAAQQPEGYWVSPRSGYAPKYTGTWWSLMFLDQFGADPGDRRVQRACTYVLEHSQAPNGGFTWGGDGGVVHCLHGGLLAALIDFGWLEDERVRAAIEWQASAITGEGFATSRGTATRGPGFACMYNSSLPCAWGAINALRGLARIPPRRRTELVRRAIADGVGLLLSRDAAVADYPAGRGGKMSPSWFKLGFPTGYVMDVLQNLEVLAELGHARDQRLAPAIQFVLSKQDDQGRWKNERVHRRTWFTVDRGASASKWVTLRACRVLKAALIGREDRR